MIHDAGSVIHVWFLMAEEAGGEGVRSLVKSILLSCGNIRWDIIANYICTHGNCQSSTQLNVCIPTNTTDIISRFEPAEKHLNGFLPLVLLLNKSCVLTACLLLMPTRRCDQE